MPGGISKEVFDAIQYIKLHTNEPIQVNDVVYHIGRSRSWLLKKFKE